MTSREAVQGLDDAPDWYRDAVMYELHVRSFCDLSEDGIGDLRGLISKLDYLHDLGVTAIWLLPFYPSPLRDDGYDIADYRSVNAGDASWVPSEHGALALLLDTSLLEKAIYELAYELNNRPGWVPIALRGIRDLLEDGVERAAGR